MYACNFESYSASIIVIDGGSLLHQVSWNKNCFFSEIINQYCNYLGNTVVFDGYDNDESTKDHKYCCQRKGISFLYHKIELEMIGQIKQHNFLSKQQNKHHLISCFGKRLTKKGVLVHQSINDAETWAIELAGAHKCCTVIALLLTFLFFSSIILGWKWKISFSYSVLQNVTKEGKNFKVTWLKSQSLLLKKVLFLCLHGVTATPPCQHWAWIIYHLNISKRERGSSKYRPNFPR